METHEEEEVVFYEQRGPVARVTMNRPRYRNAQNSKMTYALDAVLHRAAQEDSVRVIVLRGAGPCFSAGHDIGSPGRDVDVDYPRTLMWPGHVGKPGVMSRMNREQEVYLGMCRRWRDIPKPMIAMVHGACIAGGLMLAWTCDLIIASEDAVFADPAVRMGGPGVEFFAHPWQMGARFAKEFLFLGERVSAHRARELGMINRVVPLDRLEEETMAVASRIAEMPSFAITLTKLAVNGAEDAMGMRLGMDLSFALHQLAHAHSAEVSSSAIMGATPQSMRAAANVAESAQRGQPEGGLAS